MTNADVIRAVLPTFPNIGEDGRIHCSGRLLDQWSPGNTILIDQVELPGMPPLTITISGVVK